MGLAREFVWVAIALCIAFGAGYVQGRSDRMPEPECTIGFGGAP